MRWNNDLSSRVWHPKRENAVAEGRGMDIVDALLGCA